MKRRVEHQGGQGKGGGGGSGVAWAPVSQGWRVSSVGLVVVEGMLSGHRRLGSGKVGSTAGLRKGGGGGLV